MEQYKYSKILSKFSSGSFNYSFAKIVGIVPAAYFEELMTQYYSVGATKEWFLPKYSEIEKILGISKEDQEIYLSSFKSLGIVEQEEKSIKLNIDEYIRMLFNDSTEAVCSYQAKAAEGSNKKISAKTKKVDAIKDRLKSQILGNNEKVRKLYFTWIDALVDRYGAIPNSTVIMGQKFASNYANGDASIECALIEKAIINVYKDMSWAASVLEKTATIQGNISSTKPITLTQPIDSTQKEVEETYEVTFGGVV